MLATPDANMAVQVGIEGPLLVDTLSAPMTARVLEAVGRLSPRFIRHVVLTGGGDQHAGGAAAVARAGRYVRLIDGIDPRGLDARSSIIAHVNVLNRLVKAGAASDAWPTDTYFTREWALFSNGEAVPFFHVPNAVTDGDTIVFFRRSDVICAGGIYDSTAYPRFDPAAGGSIQGVIDGLNLILDVAIAGENQEGGTVVIPGRGRLSDETDVANYRDMVTIVRDRIRDMAGKGMPLERVQQARPTSDYDGIYGTPGSAADAFVEAIYRDLARSRS
jgi:glyoxylase-like metal-dependent hydrolase (beta-lactamase superfamily II)